MSDGISLALFEVEVATEVGTWSLTGCATDPLDTCMKSVRFEESKESDSVDRGSLSTVSPPAAFMTGFDMTSSSISGHHKMSLKDGNIMLLVSILLLLPKDADELEDEELAATASVAMMISEKNVCLQFQTKTWSTGKM